MENENGAWLLARRNELEALGYDRDTAARRAYEDWEMWYGKN